MKFTIPVAALAGLAAALAENTPYPQPSQPPQPVGNHNHTEHIGPNGNGTAPGHHDNNNGTIIHNNGTASTNGTSGIPPGATGEDTTGVPEFPPGKLPKCAFGCVVAAVRKATNKCTFWDQPCICAIHPGRMRDAAMPCVLFRCGIKTTVGTFQSLPPVPKKTKKDKKKTHCNKSLTNVSCSQSQAPC